MSIDGPDRSHSAAQGTGVAAGAMQDSLIEGAVKPAELHRAENAKTTLVVFGGIANGIDIPPFEFHRMTESLSVNRVFIRDMRQGWYQSQVKDGLFAGLSDGEVETVQDWFSSTRTVFIGNSMGGFAAILFGALFAADHVLAFAPQTSVSPLGLLRCRDFRWARQILRMYLRNGFVRNSHDLRKVLLKTPPKEPIEIFYGEICRYDTCHATYLSDLPGVTATMIPGARHGAVRRLRDSGQLIQVLRDACAPETTDDSETPP